MLQKPKEEDGSVKGMYQVQCKEIDCKAHDIWWGSSRMVMIIDGSIVYLCVQGCVKSGARTNKCGYKSWKGSPSPGKSLDWEAIFIKYNLGLVNQLSRQA